MKEFPQRNHHFHSVGDSGGPIHQWVSDHWEQVGIVSYGRGCAMAANPGVYTRLSAFYDWIQSITDPILDTTQLEGLNTDTDSVSEQQVSIITDRLSTSDTFTTIKQEETINTSAIDDMHASTITEGTKMMSTSTVVSSITMNITNSEVETTSILTPTNYQVTSGVSTNTTKKTTVSVDQTTSSISSSLKKSFLVSMTCLFSVIIFQQ